MSTLPRQCQTVRIRDGAKASVFNFTTYLQRVRLSSLDFKDSIPYHKTVDWLYIFLYSQLQTGQHKPQRNLKKACSLHFQETVPPRPNVVFILVKAQNSPEWMARMTLIIFKLLSLSLSVSLSLPRSEMNFTIVGQFAPGVDFQDHCLPL